MKKSELFFAIYRVVADFFSMISAFVAAYFLRAKVDFFPDSSAAAMIPFDQYMRTVFVITFLWIFIFAISGLYKISRPQKLRFFNIFTAISVGMTIVILTLFFTRETFFSRLVLFYAWVISIVFVTLSRLLILLVKDYFLHYGIGVYRTVLIGSEKMAEEIIDLLKTDPAYKLIGILNGIRRQKTLKGVKFLGEVENFEKILPDLKVDEIIQTKTILSEDETLDIIEFCRTNGIRYRFVPDQLAMQTTNVEVGALGGYPLIELKGTPLEGWGKISKRAIDIIFSLLVLILLSPLFLIIAILIKIDSKGPVFFRYNRIGAFGRPFVFNKFRSMVDGAHQYNKKLAKLNEADGPIFKIKEDPRVTKIGNFLRKTRLDELPQFINVLKGEMSLVGPRPQEPEEVEKYKKHYYRRLAVKPGITGLWQVSGQHDLKFEEAIKLDIYYIENWSLKLDFQIILKTIIIILTGKNAY